MEISPKQKGLNTELHCISYFSDCGFLVSVPYGDNGRYDLIVDVNGHLLRVQVKSASPTVDASGEISGIKFSCKSQRINTKESKTKRYSKDEIDYFATYWNYQVYVVPVEEASSSKYLRFYSSLNNQDYLSSFLEDYTVEKQWSKYLSVGEKIIEPTKDNIIKPIKRDDKEKIFCKRCGKEISRYAEYCSECASFLKRKVEQPTREELKELIRTKSFVDVGKIYNVSDNSIRKWCKKNKLPFTKKEINTYSDKEWESI